MMYISCTAIQSCTGQLWPVQAQRFSMLEDLLLLVLRYLLQLIPPNMIALLDDFCLTPRHWGWHLLAFNHIASLQISFFDSFNERIKNKIKDSMSIKAIMFNCCRWPDYWWTIGLQANQQRLGRVQMCTMCVKHNLLVAGGYQGEMVCKVWAWILCLASSNTVDNSNMELMWVVQGA
jgi:hypothetical protein